MTRAPSSRGALALVLGWIAMSPPAPRAASAADTKSALPESSVQLQGLRLPDLEGHPIDLGTYLDPQRARSEFGDYAVDAASVEGHYYATPIFAGMKGLVWYPLHEFAAAGYAPPGTWA